MVKKLKRGESKKSYRENRKNWKSNKIMKKDKDKKENNKNVVVDLLLLKKVLSLFHSLFWWLYSYLLLDTSLIIPIRETDENNDFKMIVLLSYVNNIINVRTIIVIKNLNI